MFAAIDRASTATIPNMIKKLCGFARRMYADARTDATSDLLCSHAFRCLFDGLPSRRLLRSKSAAALEVIQAATEGMARPASGVTPAGGVSSAEASAPMSYRVKATIVSHLLSRCGDMRDAFRGSRWAETSAVNERNVAEAVPLSMGFKESKHEPNFHFIASNGSSKVTTLIEFPSEETRMQEIVSVRSSMSVMEDGKSSATRKSYSGLLFAMSEERKCGLDAS